VLAVTSMQMYKYITITCYPSILFVENKGAVSKCSKWDWVAALSKTDKCIKVCMQRGRCPCSFEEEAVDNYGQMFLKDSLKDGINGHKSR